MFHYRSFSGAVSYNISRRILTPSIPSGLSNRKKRKNHGPDLISNLPVEIIHQIMSRLSEIELVQTSILSKKWYELRRNYPVLAFAPTYPLQCSPISKRDYIERALNHFTRNKITLQTFSICIKNSELFPLLDRWIKLALENNVRELKVYVWGSTYRLPSAVFCSESLTVLELRRCVLDRPLSVFGNVWKLFLVKCCLSGGVVLNLGEDCPLLEYLKIEDCYGLDFISISNFHRLKAFWM